MPNTRTLSLSAALLAALVVLPARAAETKPAEQKPAAAAAAPASKTATELAHVLVTKEAWGNGVTQTTKMIQAQFSGHPGSSLTLPAGFDKKVRTEVEGILPYEALVDIHARELSAAYSEPELAQLVTFYKSPVGQKWLKEMPQVSEKISVETQKRVDPKLNELMTKLAKEVKPPAGSSPHGQAAPAKKAPAKAPAQKTPAK